MRKFQILGLALFAVFAFSAVAAASAFAEVEGELLGNGAKIEGSGLTIEIKPTAENEFLLLEDMNATGKPDILCSGILAGTIEPETSEGAVRARLGLITKVLTLTGGEAGNLVECVDDSGICSSPVDVTAIHLPWHWEILLMKGVSVSSLWYYLFMLLLEPSNNPGYTVDCNSILGLVEDTCQAESEADGSSGPLMNETGGLLGEFSENETETEGTVPGICSVGGAKQGLLFGDGFITSPNAGTLTVSE
jgi:hypothetical protein